MFAEDGETYVVLYEMNMKHWALIVAGLLLALAMCAMLMAALFGLGLL